MICVSSSEVNLVSSRKGLASTWTILRMKSWHENAMAKQLLAVITCALIVMLPEEPFQSLLTLETKM